jgi:hypothetical protein
VDQSHPTITMHTFVALHLLVAAGSASAATYCQAPTPLSESGANILMIGDSISVSWPWKGVDVDRVPCFLAHKLLACFGAQREHLTHLYQARRWSRLRVQPPTSVANGNDRPFSYVNKSRGHVPVMHHNFLTLNLLHPLMHMVHAQTRVAHTYPCGARMIRTTAACMVHTLAAEWCKSAVVTCCCTTLTADGYKRKMRARHECTLTRTCVDNLTCLLTLLHECTLTRTCVHMLVDTAAYVQHALSCAMNLHASQMGSSGYSLFVQNFLQTATNGTLAGSVQHGGGFGGGGQV